MLEEILEDDGAAQSHETMLDLEEAKKALTLIDELDAREAQVLTLRFGLDGTEPLTLKDIGQHLGLTRERVRQIQHGALAKLNEFMTV